MTQGLNEPCFYQLERDRNAQLSFLEMRWHTWHGIVRIQSWKSVKFWSSIWNHFFHLNFSCFIAYCSMEIVSKINLHLKWTFIYGNTLNSEMSNCRNCFGTCKLDWIFALHWEPERWIPIDQVKKCDFQFWMWNCRWAPSNGYYANMRQKLMDTVTLHVASRAIHVPKSRHIKPYLIKCIEYICFLHYSTQI